MKKITIALDDQAPQTFLIAERYSDLPPKLAMAVLKLAYTQDRTLETRLAVFHLVCDAPIEVKELFLQADQVGNLQRLLEQIEWAWQTGVEKRPMASFAAKGANYLLPDEELRQVSTGEFITAVAYLLAFSDTHSSSAFRGPADPVNKERFLNQFLAAICRPKVSLIKRLQRNKDEYTGDDREPFNSYFLDSRAERFSSVDLATRIAILQWFLAAVSRAEQLYGMPAPDPTEKKAVLHTGTFVRDWETTVHNLAKEGNFGNYDAVMGRSIHDVLGYLELKKLNQEDESE
jgi:hypothetical protein